MKEILESLYLKRTVSIIVLMILLIAGCGIFGSKDEVPFELKPDAVCTNSTSDEWTYLGLDEEAVHSILVHPQNPRIIFAGTSFDFSAQRDGKIFVV